MLINQYSGSGGDWLGSGEARPLANDSISSIDRAKDQIGKQTSSRFFE
jgi:hypothetical protein